MSKYFLILTGVCFLLAIGCQPPAEEKAEKPPVDLAAEKKSVQEVLEKYIAAVEREDMEAYAEVVAHDTEMVNIGGGAAHYIVGWDALVEVMNGQNEAFTDTTITQSDLKINMHPDGKIAWATCRWDLKATVGENPVELPIRCTWILEKRDAGWLIAHFHKSVGLT